MPIREGDLGAEFVVFVKYNPDNTNAKDIKISLDLPLGYKLGSKSTEIINIAGK